MIRAALFLIALLAFSAWAFSGDGMDRCQRVASFDTCFHTLYR